jgi:CO dehydrogenase nickel-insertion accessory protein CooC1
MMARVLSESGKAGNLLLIDALGVSVRRTMGQVREKTIKTAQKGIASLIKKMIEVDHVAKCERMGLVFNRVMGNEKLLRRSAEDIGLELFGLVPYDENIASHDLVGKPITELPESSSGLSAYRDIVAKCILG